MDLPADIEDYLRRRIFDRRKPCCLRLDVGNRVLEAWGDTSYFGLKDLSIGDDAVELIPMLADIEFDEKIEMPFVTDTGGHTYHAHFVPAGESRYVVLLDAAEELRERQHYQQITNEVKLVLERERRLISDLVDAKAELTVRRKEAEEESRRRGEYIAVMSHEFRAPLSAMLAHGERLLSPLGTNETAQIGHAIQRIGRAQLWLIDNLLAKARLESDAFNVHRSVTDVAELADELAVVFAPLAAEKELSFSAGMSADVPKFVMLDELHFRQVLANLLANAIKYTDVGEVRLEFDYADDKILASVSDSGKGIPQADQKTIFAPFNRGRETPSVPGAGLGLGIVRQLVDAMDGTLALDSNVGQGTRVKIELVAATVLEASEASSSTHTSTIVVGEDDPDMIDLLRVRLVEAGYSVQCVSDGESLIKEVLAHSPSLVLLDINMPRLDGPAAARQLREHGFRAPILALSGAASRRDIEYALSSGCTEFMRKPPHMSALKRLIARLILAHSSDDASSPD